MSVSVLEMPHTNEQAVPCASNEPELVVSGTPNAMFSESEIQSMVRDDAMASAVVAIMLGFAFLVLFGLVMSVNIWMASIAG